MSTFKQGAYISLYKSSFVQDMRINVFFLKLQNMLSSSLTFKKSQPVNIMLTM